MSRPTCSSSKLHTVCVSIPHDEPHPGTPASPHLGGQRRSLTGVVSAKSRAVWRRPGACIARPTRKGYRAYLDRGERSEVLPGLRETVRDFADAALGARARRPVGLPGLVHRLDLARREVVEAGVV